MRYALLPLVAAVIGLLTFGSAARAEPPQPVETDLALETQPTQVGKPVTIVAHLETAAGEPISDGGVQFLLNGQAERRVRTDSDGTASLVILRDLPAGRYEVSALFSGVPSQGLQPSGMTTELQIAPAVLEIETVPPLSGVRFTLTPDLVQDGIPPEDASEGFTFISGADGIARTGVEQTGLYQLEVHEWDDNESGVRAEFSRWFDEFTPTRELNFFSSTRLEIGFDLSYLVDLGFAGLEGQAIDPERVESITLASTLGGTQTFHSTGPQWLQGGRVVRRDEGLEETKAIYSVQSVIVDGSNVVNRSQQRFAPDDRRQWQIQLLLYSVHISVRDALFRFPIGSAVRLEFPDGSGERLPLGSGGELTVGSLARGEYRVSVDGPGISFSRPVTLTRDQEVDLLFMSYLDIAVTSMVIVSLALALLFIGRPQLLSSLRARVLQVWRATGWEDHL